MLQNEVATEFEHLLEIKLDDDLKNAESMDKESKMHERTSANQRLQSINTLAAQRYKRIDEELDSLSGGPLKVARQAMGAALEEMLDDWDTLKEERDALKEERDALKEQNAKVSQQVKVQCKKTPHPLKHFSFIRHHNFHQYVTQQQILARLQQMEDEIGELKADRKKKAQKKKARKNARKKKASDSQQQPSNPSP